MLFPILAAVLSAATPTILDMPPVPPVQHEAYIGRGCVSAQARRKKRKQQKQARKKNRAARRKS